ncbi:MAG: hypothetical protein AAF918_16820 [Pseudomonadota bacterium]
MQRPAIKAILLTSALVAALPAAQVASANVLPALTSAAAAPAEIRNRRAQRASSGEARRFRSGERTTRQTRTETGFERNTTWTGENGRTASRDTVVDVDRENKSYSRRTVRTGPEGNQTSTDVNGSYDPETGFTRNGTKTFADGTTASKDTNAFYDRDSQTFTKTVTRTNRAGESETFTTTRERTTEDGE